MADEGADVTLPAGAILGSRRKQTTQPYEPREGSDLVSATKAWLGEGHHLLAVQLAVLVVAALVLYVVLQRRHAQRRVEREEREESEAQRALQLENDRVFARFFAALLGDGLVIHWIAPDGNCLFAALADQLHEHGLTPGQVRHRVVEYLEDHRDYFEGFLLDGEWDGYVRNMRRRGVWGGNLELFAAARVFARPIVVYRPDGSHNTIRPDDTATPRDVAPLRISYHDENHYASVLTHAHAAALLGDGVHKLSSAERYVHTRTGVDDAVVLRAVLTYTTGDMDDAVTVARAIHRHAEEA